MRNLFPILIPLCLPWFLSAQNLVPNPGFEEFHYCPPYPGQILAALHWDSPNNTTTDYFHRCSPPAGGAGVPDNLLGRQEPHSGNAYAGIRTWNPVIPGNPQYREYLAVQLLAPLEAGRKYEIRFWASPAENAAYVSDDLGCFLSPTPFPKQDLYPVLPQLQNPEGRLLEDESNWLLFRSFYTALGGERFLLLGNFLGDEQMTRVLKKEAQPTVYYYIDDVEVNLCPPAPPTLVVDTLFCPDQPLLLKAPVDALSASWSDGYPSPARVVAAPGRYTRLSDFGCFILEESFRLSSANCDCELLLPGFLRAGSDWRRRMSPFIQELEIELLDALGRGLTRWKPGDNLTFPSFLAAGIYFWRAEYECRGKRHIQAGKVILEK